MTGLRHARHWIGEDWIDVAKPAQSVDPATGEPIGIYTEAGEAEAALAVVAASGAFRTTTWRDDRRLRAKVLNQMADHFEALTDDLVATLSLENGKIRSEARFEVGMVSLKLRFYAAAVLTEFGRAVEVTPGRYSTTLRQPVGVTGVIAPWPPPVVLFIRCLPPELTAGCISGEGRARRRSRQRDGAHNQSGERAQGRRPGGSGLAAGAKVVVRGGRFTDGPLAKGAFYRPTLLEIEDHRLAIAREEVFGPVLLMQAFDTEQEAVALANDSEYGLAASVWSTDVDRPLRIARQIDAGTVWINTWAVVHDGPEEGGFKQSGLGRLNGLSAMDDSLEYRTIIYHDAV